MLARLNAHGYNLKSNSILDEVFNYSAKSNAAANQMNSMFEEEEEDSANTKKAKTEELSNFNADLFELHSLFNHFNF